MGIFSFLSRNAWDNIATLSNRTVFWEDAANVASNINGNTLIGFGINGHIESGISSRTDWVFEHRSDNVIHTLHNTIIQMFIDRGIIGLLLFQAVIFFLLDRLSRAGNIGLRMGLVILGFLLFGQTESLFSVAPIDTFTIFIFLMVICSSSFLDKNLEHNL